MEKCWCSGQQDIGLLVGVVLVFRSAGHRLACRRSAAVFRSAGHRLACRSSAGVRVSRTLGLLVGEVLQYSGQQDIRLACWRSAGVQVSRT